VHVRDSFGWENAMRGDDERSDGFFSYVRLEARIPADHPLRAIRELVDAALLKLSAAFDRLYAHEGRPSIPPERLLRALLLQAFYTVRSERQLMEQLDYNLLFRWFVGLSTDDPVWDATVFCKNRDRLLDGDIAAKFFASVLNLPQVGSLLSSEHFCVDGTLVEAWASMKSFVPKEGCKPPSGKGRGRHGRRNAERDFHGEKRSNDTHSSTTDPNARLFRKAAGKEAKLCYMGHLMMENRNSLIVDARLTEANGTAERATALDMIEDNAKPGSTVGGDKNYDTVDFVAGCRERGCMPHVSQNDTNRRSAIDARTTRHSGYRISTIKRKRIEEPFGWMKTIGGLRKTRHRGRGLVEWFFVLTAAAYNLIPIPKILAATG
jgi:transposase